MTTRDDLPFVAFVAFRRNVLRLTYPALMDEIPVSRFGEAHLLEITELRLPREGFFTLRMTALYLVSRHMWRNRAAGGGGFKS